jgi:D-alanyl-D-alanine carboxypeptidase
MSGLNKARHLIAVCIGTMLSGLAIASLLCIQPSLAGYHPKFASIVVDGNTGKVLHDENADEARYPASLTKMMTLYILFDYLDKKRITYETKFYVTPNAAAQPPSKLGLKAGDYIRVYDIIGALVTKSANDAAASVAENIAGSVDKFARLMTARAKSLGMLSTVFKNASGLPDPQQVTTARDMARLSMRIMNDFPKYATFFKLRNFAFKGRSFRNHNGLLFTYQGMEGIKTGYTRDSGFNLTTSVRRGDKHLIAVVLGGATAKIRNAAMAHLLNVNLSKAVAMAKRRPMEQKIAQLDEQAGNDTNRYVTNASSANWQRPVATETAARPMATATASIDTDNAPVVRDAYARRPNDVGFDIQIGAYQSRDEAISKLTGAQTSAKLLLSGHAPYIMMFEKNGVNYPRARFAGFASKDGATTACSHLKRQLSISCIVMTP